MASSFSTSPQPRLTLAVVSAAVFMLLLDMTIVSVALADLRRDLVASLAALQWVVDAYTLALAGLLLAAATIGDRIGRKRTFVIGLAIFTAASAACGFSWDVAALNTFRAAQGIGGALLYGTALPLLGEAYPDSTKRARAIGIFGATLAAATAAGPLIGGALVSGPGWRWIFLVNVPIGLITLVAARRMPDSRPTSGNRVDILGAGLLTAALLALLFALIRGNNDGWATMGILGLFAAFVGLLAGFIARELTATDPMLDLSLFARPAFGGIAVASLSISATLIGATYYVALYLQTGLGYSPFATGLRLLPLTLASFVAAPVTAIMTRVLGTAVPTVISLVLAGAGLLLMAVMDAHSSWTVLVLGLVVAGAGLGVASVAYTSAALDAVEPSRAGMATGTISTMRQIGTAAGVAALGAVFQQAATDRATNGLADLRLPPDATRQLADAAGSGAGRFIVDGLPGALQSVAARIVDIAVSSISDALVAVLTWGGIIALIAAMLCAGLLVASGRETERVAADEGGRPTAHDFNLD